MFRNYLTVAIRTLWRDRMQSIINVVGLALGMACALLMSLLIVDELSFDQFHAKGNRLYKAYNRSVFEGQVSCWGVTPAPLAPALKAEYAGIAATTRYTWPNGYLATYGSQRLKLKTVFVDPDFLTMFSFPLVQGQARTALNSPKSVVLTQQTARKLFGTTDPVGKIIRFDNQFDLLVSGVMQDLPTNTQFDFEILLPYAFIKTLYGWDDVYWGNNSYQTFVELTPNASLPTVNAAIREVTISHSKKQEDNEVFLYPLERLRLYGQFANGVEAGGAITYMRMVGYIAAFILLLACINFMNLSTARSEKRGREVGIRKVVGASRWSLAGQFLGESLLLTGVAFVLALLLAQLMLPLLNPLLIKSLSIPYGSGLFWLCCAALVSLTSALAGSYPALFLSGMEPVRVLKGRLAFGRSNLTPRQLLVVFQFVITISLLISTVVVKRQLAHTQQRDMGYNRANLVYTNFEGEIEKKHQLIRDELLRQQIATAVCTSSGLISRSGSNTWGLTWRGKPEGSKITFDQMNSSGDFVKTMGLTLVAGRDLDQRTYPTDSLACLINESAAKIMGFRQPLGEVIRNDNRDFRIVGVFKDFVWGSPFGKVPPMLVRGGTWLSNLHYRLNPALPMAVALKKAEAVFRHHNPAFPFEATFIDSEFQLKYERMMIVGKMADGFAGLAILIACLGLFGLATFMAERRTKEIGVRKSLGADVPSLVGLLNRDFLKLVVVAIVVAIPLSWWLMDRWLQDYSYRTSLDWWLFALAGGIAVSVALLTVSYQSIRAALTNPVDALRSE
jgi:putative ABC transport system permease protein